MALSNEALSFLSQYQNYANTALAQYNNYTNQFINLKANSTDPGYSANLQKLSSDFANFKSTVSTNAGNFEDKGVAIFESLSGDDANTFDAEWGSITSISKKITKSSLDKDISNAITSAKSNQAKSAPTQNKSEDDSPIDTVVVTDKRPVTPTKKQANITPASATAQRPTNPLSKFTSSTYRLSLYMVPISEFNIYQDTGTWNLKNLTLIVKSGGITPGIDSNRSRYFDLDLYIDNLEIQTIVSEKVTGISTTSYDFKFQIMEPYAINFSDNLVNAAIEMQKRENKRMDINNPINALYQHYLLAIEFVGYDNNGVIQTNDKTLIRYFPIQIIKMNFKLENKLTVYEINAKLTPEYIATSKTISNFREATTVSATTVEDALNKLAAAFNASERVLSGPDKNQEIPNEFFIKFEKNSKIASALLIDKNHYLVDKTPMPSGQPEPPESAVLSSLGINVRLSESASAEVVKQQRQITAAPGVSWYKIIDQIITQSEYIISALKVVDKEQLDKVKSTDRDAVVNNKPEPLYWYHITPSVKIKGIDKKSNRFAYSITFVIQQKEIPYVRALAIGSTTTYKGPYKRYDYWYSGQNKEILSYEQSYNMLYYVTAAANSAIANSTNQYDDPSPVHPTTTTDSSPTGSLPNSKETVNTVKTSLYSPYDSLHAQIKILGDPDYLMTSEASIYQIITQKTYGEDYTINPASGQVFIELGFSQVKDYNYQTNDGLLRPNNDITFWNYTPEIKKMTGNRMIYMLLSLKSHFSKGLFTQDLKTVLPPFNSNNTVNVSTPTDERNTDTESTTTSNTTTSSTSATPTFGKFDPGVGNGWDSDTPTKPKVQTDSSRN